MSDTVRTPAALQTILGDGQLPGAITAQDVRDLLVSIPSHVGVVNVMEPRFGAKGDGTTDDSAAIVAAIAVANSTPGGAKVIFPPGIYLWASDTEAVISNGGVIIEGSGNMGKTFASSAAQGTKIKVGASQTGAVIRFAVDAGANNTAGCGIRNISFDGDRTYTVANAAIHVQAADNFIGEHVVIQNINGRGLRCTRTVLSSFSDFYVKNSGAAGLNAIALDPTVAGNVQGSTFAQFKVETCYDSTYFNVGSNVFSCKFDNFGFEANPANASTLQTFLNDLGTRSQFGKAHFNRTDSTSTLPKATFGGVKCQYQELEFAGAKSATATAGDFVVTGSRNKFGLITIDGTALTPSVASILSFLCSGNFNTFESVTGAVEGGFTLSGSGNTVGCYMSDGGDAKVTLSGTNNDVVSGEISGSTINGSPVVTISGGRSTAKLRIINPVNASEAVLISGTGRLSAGSYITGVTNGYGVHLTVSQSSCDGVVLDTIGKHGIFIDACEPRSISNNQIRACSGLGASTYNGISFESSANKNTGGICHGNRIENGANTHLHAIFVTDNAGTPRYGNWIFTSNNHASGGDFSVSTGTNIIANQRS